MDSIRKFNMAVVTSMSSASNSSLIDLIVPVATAP